MNNMEKYKDQIDSIEFKQNFNAETSYMMRRAYHQKEKNMMLNKKTTALLVAAILTMLLTLCVGAVSLFLFPDGLKSALDIEIQSVKAVIDTGTADSNSVKTVCKTFSNEEYTVTFEAIAEGNCLREVFDFSYSSSSRTTKLSTVDRTFAVFTVKRNDGGNVLCLADGNGLTPADIGYIILIKGYAPNPCMLCDNYCIGLYEENNILYVACDITDANIFADEELYIAVTNRMVINYETVYMDENDEFHYSDNYDGIPALFDFDLDNSKADHEKAEEYKKTHPFMTYEEFAEALNE